MRSEEAVVVDGIVGIDFLLLAKLLLRSLLRWLENAKMEKKKMMMMWEEKHVQITPAH
jgi:hypothetical protein